MDDLISRQAAIDILSLGKEILSRVLGDIDVVGRDREKYLWGIRLIESNINDIEELPSAQPEIIRCRDCRKYLRLGCPMGITVFDAPDPDGYCYKSEGRTDECTD